MRGERGERERKSHMTLPMLKYNFWECTYIILLKLVVADLLVVIPAFDVEVGVGRRSLNYDCIFMRTRYFF